MTTDRLSADRHEEIRQEIREDYLAACKPNDKPKAIILAGQPGSGKGKLASTAQTELEMSGGSVLIDPDLLRQRHPRYGDYVRQNDKSAAEHIHPDASQWAKELRRDAIDGRRNIIIDGTLNDKDKAHELLSQLRSAGYETEIRALAVTLRESRQGVYARYENAKENGKEGRWVPESIQDEAYDGMPVALGHIERNGWADKVSVVRRDGTLIYRNDRAATATSGLSQLAVKAERGRDPTEEEKLRHLRAWDRIQGQMRRRGAPEQDIATVADYRSQAHDRMKSDRPPEVSRDRAEPVPRPGADSIRALGAAQKARREEGARQSR
jgi:hypothetical protein